jgi:hypothetical protein
MLRCCGPGRADGCLGMITVSTLGIENIIRAVEAQGSKLTSNEEALAKCIEISAHWYSEALIYSSRHRQKMQRSAARRSQATANDLLTQLGNDQPVFYPSFVENLDLLKKQLSDFSAGIETLLGLQSDSVPSSGVESDFVDALAYQHHFKALSPLEWLVGVYLIETYAINFRAKPGTVQKSYIAFAMAVLKELRIKNGNSSYSVESVRRATRGLRKRRKVKEVDDTMFTVERQQHLYAVCGRDWKHESLRKTLEALKTILKLRRANSGQK